MADFCGLTRVKTWRWSRLFACAVLLFCVVFHTPSFGANGYVCQDAYAICNPGFLLTASSSASNPDSAYVIGETICMSCPEGYYKIKRDTKTSATTGTYEACLECPANGTCPEIGYGSVRSYGRPIVLCNKGYYRDYTSDGNKLQCLPCSNVHPGLSKNADDQSNPGLDVSWGQPLTVGDDGKVKFKSGYLGPEQCKLCADNYYKRGYYTNTNYMPADMCVSCPTDNVKECKTTGEILCKQNYYRSVNSDGTVKCEPCGPEYDKPADTPGSKGLGKEQCYNHCSTSAYMTARKDENSQLVGECALISTINPGDSNAYMVEGGDSYDKIVCKHGYFPIVDNTPDSPNYGKVTCGACPTGMTTADPDKEGTTVGKEEDAEAGQWWNSPSGVQGWEPYCTNCDVGWFVVPNPTDCYSPNSPLNRKICLKCPTGSNAKGVVGCGGASYNGVSQTSSFTGDEMKYLLCKQGYYVHLKRDYDDGSRYCNDGGGSPRIDEATCQPCNDNASSGENQTYPDTWLSVAEWEARYVSNYPDITQGSGQCNACANGYFVPLEYGGSGSETTCFKCPENYSSCKNSYVGCKANTYLYDNGNETDYKNRFSCRACPAFTGKNADNSNHLAQMVSEKECNICVDGYYGDPVKDGVFNRLNCEPCPMFAKLNVMGICIHGHTLKPTNNTPLPNGNSENMCFVRNSAVNFTDDNNKTYQFQPEFTDTTGTFVFDRDNGSKTCPMTESNKNISGVCQPEAGQYCVYVNMDIGNGNKLDNPDACVRAIMWRSKVDDAYTISPGTAEDIMHHWGKDNPWYCATPKPANDTTEALVNAKTVAKQEAQAFVACLTGGNPDCMYNGKSCMLSDNSGTVKVCETDVNGVCTDVTN